MDKDTQDLIAEYSSQMNGLRPNNRVDFTQGKEFGTDSGGRPYPLEAAPNSPYDDRVVNSPLQTTGIGDAPDTNVPEDRSINDVNRSRQQIIRMNQTKMMSGTPMGDKLNALIARAASGTASPEQMRLLMRIYSQGL